MRQLEKGKDKGWHELTCAEEVAACCLGLGYNPLGGGGAVGRLVGARMSTPRYPLGGGVRGSRGRAFLPPLPPGRGGGWYPGRAFLPPLPPGGQSQVRWG